VMLVAVTTNVPMGGGAADDEMSAWKAKCSNVLSYCAFKANKKCRRDVVNIATIQSMDAGLRAVKRSVWKEGKR
jgi:hypothetical protein